MSSRSGSTQLYDAINLKIIRANAPAYTSLTSDGVGGTYWSTLSSPMAFISAFKYICTPAKTYIADASYNFITFNSGQGIQFVPTKLFSTTLYANAFNEIAVPGLSTLSSGQNTFAFSTLTLSSLGNTLFTTNTLTNTLTYEIRYPTFAIGDTRLFVDDRISSITFAGQGGIVLSTAYNSYIGLQISTFTSKGYLALFSNTSTISTATISTLSSLYTTKSTFQSIIQFYIPNIVSSLSTVHSLTNSTSYLVGGSNTSTLFSRHYLNMKSAISSLSTSLYYEMFQKTSTFIQSTFESKYFYQNSDRNRIRNLIYDLNDMSSTMSSFISPVLSTILQDAADYKSLSTSIYSHNSSVNSTIKNLSSYALMLGGLQFSTFALSMSNKFTALSNSGFRRDRRMVVPYTLNSGIRVSNGYQHDVLLSTCEIDLSPLVPYIDLKSRIFIEYTPSYAFKTLTLASNGTNTYPLSTFITHDGYFLKESVFTDMMSFNTLNLPKNPYTYQDLYNRPIRLEVNALTVLYSPITPYVINHLHSSIVNLNNVDLFINDPQYNMYGGVVVPNTYTRDCALNIYTTVQWSNSMNSSNAVSVYIHNGIKN